MPLHVFCYLGQNKQNEHNEEGCQPLNNNKMVCRNNSASAANLNCLAEPEEKPAVSFQSIFGTIAFLLRFQQFWSLPFWLFSFQKRPRKRAHCHTTSLSWSFFSPPPPTPPLMPPTPARRGETLVMEKGRYGSYYKPLFRAWSAEPCQCSEVPASSWVLIWPYQLT